MASSVARKLLGSVAEGLRGARRWKWGDGDEREPLTASRLPEMDSFDSIVQGRRRMGSPTPRGPLSPLTKKPEDSRNPMSTEMSQLSSSNRTGLRKFLAKKGISTDHIVKGFGVLEDEEEEWSLLMGSTFLEDALAYRDPNYRTDPKSMGCYLFRQSRGWQICTSLAVLAYMAACFLGRPAFVEEEEDELGGTATLETGLQSEQARIWGMGLEAGCVVFFFVDIFLLISYTGMRSTVTCWWKVAFIGSLFLSLLDLVSRHWTGHAWSRLFRPIVFHFVSRKVRDCSVATFRAMAVVFPVLVLELLVTLAYSCVCVVLYHSESEAPFTSLFDAFMSLFLLSTTANDPDVWMPLYDRNNANVLIFSSFLVLQVFLLHNIVLAVVWNEFGERMRDYAAQKREWRQESVRRAFKALDMAELGYISKEKVLMLLRMTRPHYSHSKLLMMYERMVQGNGVQRGHSRTDLDNETEVTQVHRKDFYSNVVEAVSLRIRTLREKNLDRLGRYLMLPLHLWNLVFVLAICVMSPWVFNSRNFWLCLIPTSLLLGGSVVVEIVLSGVRAYVVPPWNRVKAVSMCLTIMGFTWVAVLTPISNWTSLFSVEESEPTQRLDVAICLLMSARCLDLGTLLGYVPSIHSVVSVMYTITPNLFAQAGVIFTIFHVYAYVGMVIYGGVITADRDYGDTPFGASPFYYENNFNSYPESLVTLFEVLVGNNWNIIITGYIQVSPMGMWSYLFFLSFIVVAVTLALNVLTAIFMNAFTVKTSKANTSARRGVASHSISSQSARTALGAGASLALRPNPSSYFTNFHTGPPFPVSSSTIDVVSTKVLPTNSPTNSGTEIGTRTRTGDRTGTRTGASPSARSRSQSKESNGFSSGESGDQKETYRRRRGRSSGGVSGRFSPPLPHAAASSAGTIAEPSRKRSKDMNKSPQRPGLGRLRRQQQLSLPEGEVLNVSNKNVRREVSPDEKSSVAETTDSYLGWGGAVVGSGQVSNIPVRSRWGSGHYYQVSRRNSYSEKEMFEPGGFEQEDIGIGVVPVLAALGMGLGTEVGVRVCILRRKEDRIAPLRRKSNRSMSTGCTDSSTGSPMADAVRCISRSEGYGDGKSDEGLVEFESRLIFQSPNFQINAVHHINRFHRSSGDVAPEIADAALRATDELIDALLHSAFAEAIAAECPAHSSTALKGQYKKSNLASSATLPGSMNYPKGPLQGGAVRLSRDDSMPYEDDSDLPKVVGERSWVKLPTYEPKKSDLTKGHHTMDVICVLAARQPSPLVVYTSRGYTAKVTE